MKTLVVGGTKDFGLQVTQFFGPNSLGIGRSNGYDICVSENRKNIIKMSLDYDLVILLASAGSSQAVLAEEMAIHWLENNYDGYMVCFGSTAVYHDVYNRPVDSWSYIRSKEGLKALSRYVGKKAANHKVKMRFTTIHCGRLDNEKARNKDDFNVGLKSDYICNMIQWLYNGPKDVAVHELFVDPKY